MTPFALIATLGIMSLAQVTHSHIKKNLLEEALIKIEKNPVVLNYLKFAKISEVVNRFQPKGWPIFLKLGHIFFMEGVELLMAD